MKESSQLPLSIMFFQRNRVWHIFQYMMYDVAVIIKKLQMISVQEEKRENQKSEFGSSNITLFYQSTRDNYAIYPASLSLIRIPSITPPSQVTLQHLLEPSFPTLGYTLLQLVDFSTIVLQKIGGERRGQKLHELVSAIAGRYYSVSYHNFSHAFNLMLINFQCMELDESLRSLYTEEEYFYILIAALAHDLAHPGTNNQFEIKSGSNLAKETGGQSVLQHMHVRILWKIIQEHPQLNFLLFATDIKQAKKIITRLILNTDMSFHFGALDSLKKMRQSGKLSLTPQGDHKWIVMEQIFHACDIGNPCMDYDSYISWAALLTYEFDQQARQEESLGLKVSQNFLYKGFDNLYKDQQWFLGSIVQPLWKELTLIFPKIQIFCDNLEGNLQRVKNQRKILLEE